jgi:ATP-dependent RNA helicase RhlE
VDINNSSADSENATSFQPHKIIIPVMAFKNLALIDPILKALDTEGYTTPTPIQEQAIPLILQQRDLLGCAQTGTGKTAAFAIPILQLLHTQKKHQPGIKVLILTPTRELAIQIDESFAAYGRFTGITHTVIFGGVSQLNQTNALRKGVDVLIATPGRLLDLMSQGFIDLRHLQIFVLDEADRMLDMGFIHDVKKVIVRLPAKRQTLFFSATMPPEIQKLASVLLTNPAKVEVTPPSSTVDKIEQHLYYTNKPDKQHLLEYLLQNTEIVTALVFTRTKHGADKVVKFLHRSNIKAAAIHGNKSQNARQNALSDFKSGALRVLVATDIAARGIDIDQLTHVFNFDLPNVPETYVHRIGRTGRAGNTGISISFCDAEERTELRDIQKLIAKNIPVVKAHPFAMSANALAQKIMPKVAQPSFKRQRNFGGNNNKTGGKRYGQQRTGNK